MAPKKRRQANNKENIEEKLTSMSIQSIIDQHLKQFELDFNQECQQYQNRLDDKLMIIHQEFEKYMQTHEIQGKLARSLDLEITRLHQQQQVERALIEPSQQELLEKTTDLMNTSAADTSRTKTYLVGELQKLPMGQK